MNETNKQLNISIELEKGAAALRQARILFGSQEYDGSISRAYYAIFHYALALLLTKGIEPRSHEGLTRFFNLHFIKNGILPKRYSTMLSHAQKAREDADYRPEIPFTEEDAVTRLQEAESFITAIAALLRQTGFQVL
ncbi:MAG: HEPN domain-containing protein [Deltaproteobacteria bacterium]|nr:HEPN domain-containing protein [Deltaproteobacteria bacterium]